MQWGFIRQTFINVLLTLIFIFIIKRLSIQWDIPFMREVAKEV